MKRRSSIWLLEKQKFIELVENSNSITEVLSFFDMRNCGSNYLTLVKRFKEEGIDYSKFSKNRTKTSGLKRRTPIDKILISNSKVHRGLLKKTILNNNLIEYCCDVCKLKPLWNNIKLVLILDHINGIYNDNRLENLRFLCPNCNSQTSTFAGRNKTKTIKTKICGECFKEKCLIISSCCSKCSRKKNGRKPKIVWPSKEELQKLVWGKPTTALAKELGVSDKAIDKWCKKYKINKPPRGYWRKMQVLDNGN